MTLEEILKLSVQFRASDIHLKHGLMPVVRAQGVLYPLSKDAPRFSSEQIEALFMPFLSDIQKKKFAEGKEVDLSFGISNMGRFRLNLFRQRGTTRAVVRAISNQIPALEDLHLPPIIKTIAEFERGLVLVTGVTGSGKSTTCAALVDHINQNFHKHIISIEDPIEYLVRDHKSVITQREVGSDTESFATALRTALRQDPDVIFIGEMRDKETIDTALVAAETGHLVISTLHSSDAKETIHRILSVYPDQQQKQIRLQLASILKACISQRLLQRKDGGGYIPAAEIMLNNARISDLLINAERTRELTSAIEEGHNSFGMQSFDQSMMALLTRGEIELNEALKNCTNPDDFALRYKGVVSLASKNYQGFDHNDDADSKWDASSKLELDKPVFEETPAVELDFKFDSGKTITKYKIASGGDSGAAQEDAKSKQKKTTKKY